jgi:hypothetical protein
MLHQYCVLYGQSVILTSGVLNICCGCWGCLQWHEGYTNLHETELFGLEVIGGEGAKHRDMPT